MASVIAGGGATRDGRRCGRVRCERGKSAASQMDGELNSRLILESVAGAKRSAVSESEIRFAHTRDKVLTVVACFLTVAIVVVMKL
jgi:hypothetical protein